MGLFGYERCTVALVGSECPLCTLRRYTAFRITHCDGISYQAALPLSRPCQSITVVVLEVRLRSTGRAWREGREGSSWETGGTGKVIKSLWVNGNLTVVRDVYVYEKVNISIAIDTQPRKMV